MKIALDNYFRITFVRLYFKFKRYIFEKKVFKK